ncbi:MAG TPA: Lon family ATP-dependent protease [Negativicutes bacterium]|nr:Lon family ATP-dependent protease [Negativicutes bacterium]
MTEEELRKFTEEVLEAHAVFNMCASVWGPEKVVLRASKFGALELMQSSELADRVLALQRMVMEDLTLEERPTMEEIPHVLEEIMNEMADQIARRSVEDNIEKKIAQKMEERHQEFVQEIRMQILKDESSIETPQTQKKLEKLKLLSEKSLTKSMNEILRPATLDEIIGQERAVEVLRSKLASPYPQHLILYGPPGVGKTTAARLVLEEAKKLPYTPFAQDAAFVEVDGSSLRWDPRDITNPLLGSVHDPIYQGARRDLAETAVPEPKPGLVTDAHGGILFIDEIGEMDPMLLNKLLKVLEDKRVFFESAYYDETDPNVPEYIKMLFKEGAPADFVLIGATTRDAGDLNPALRSRCAEVYFEPLTPKQIEMIVTNAASKLKVRMDETVPTLISEYTVEGRKAVSLLADSYSLALYRRGKGRRNIQKIKREDVFRVLQVSRMTPYVNRKASTDWEIGKVFGLGVSGYLGSVIEIEAVCFPAAQKGKGVIRFNDTAGSMAKDSVFNAASLVRQITGRDLAKYDIHVNIIGGGQIDGPSAGLAILSVLISVITEKPLRQDVAVTGEVSIRGKLKAVGGVFEKAYGAKQAGVNVLIIPKENEKDIPADHLGLSVRPLESAEDALSILFGKDIKGEGYNAG